MSNLVPRGPRMGKAALPIIMTDGVASRRAVEACAVVEIISVRSCLVFFLVTCFCLLSSMEATVQWEAWEWAFK